MKPNVRLFQQATTLSARSALAGTPTRRIGLSVRAFASKTAVKMADRVHRITMFKMPKKADQDTMIEQYKVLGDKQQKVSTMQSYSDIEPEHYPWLALRASGTR